MFAAQSLDFLKVSQSTNGYRFSIDPILLSSFAPTTPTCRILDLGTGSGIIPLILAGRGRGRVFTGIELQPEMAQRARESVAANGFDGQIEILCGDVRRIRELIPPQSYDLVLTNPPYRKPGTGRIAPNDERAMARHEIAGGLTDFLSAAAWALGDGGRFCIVYLPERLPELLARMQEVRVEPKRLRMVHSRIGDDACLVLVEGRKGGRPGLAVERPLVLYEGEAFSAEVLAMYNG